MFLQLFRSLVAISSRFSRLKKYLPNPIDTSDIVIPKELLSLTEKIAENTHEVWSAGRIREGWKYGEKRDDENKQTPCLVPYSELPESEKDFDRNTSLETIKLIIKLGYKIVSCIENLE